MNNPSNSEFLSLKPLRLQIKSPKSSSREDEVSPTCQKDAVVINDDKYSMPLIEEAMNEDLPMSEERRKPTCDVCHKSFDSVKAVQGHMRIHPKIPGQKKRAIDECKMSSKKIKISNSWGEVENRERKRKNHQEDSAIRVSDNIMFLDSRMGRESTTNQNWSRNRDDPGGEQEKINGALNLLYLKYGMDWEEYTHQNSCTSTKRLITEGDVAGLSHAEVVMGSDIGINIWVSTGPTTHIPESSVQNPVEAESLKEKESSMNTSTQIPIAKEKGKEKMIVSSGGKGNHVCGICDESFSSHRALGGHMTRHRENKLKLGGGDGRGGDKKKKNVERDHVCEICGEVYPTGQQLGGHKRRHFRMKNEVSKPICASSSSVISKEVGEVAKGDVSDNMKQAPAADIEAPEEQVLVEQASARVVCHFDLNVAAVGIEEDGGHALVS